MAHDSGMNFSAQTNFLGERDAIISLSFLTTNKLRFPVAAAKVYAKYETEYTSWVQNGRLHVVGLDLRDLCEVERFCAFVKERFGRVDAIINNACQTVRRPANYYKEQVNKEAEREPVFQECLGACDVFEAAREARDAGRTIGMGATTGKIEADEAPEGAKGTVVVKDGGGGGGGGESNAKISKSAAMSLMPLTSEDMSTPSSLLPSGLHDINGQQLDMRRHNSWLLTLPQVSTPEIIECMYINVISPFVMNSRLLPLMVAPPTAATSPSASASPASSPPRFIINVSAMEGKFYRYKTPNHPHTNMAKAALNMMTRTSSESLASQGIYMNSVDTGWINDENPVEIAGRTAVNNNFQTPIDEIDAAARVLDPIFSALQGGELLYGKFLKDFRDSEW